MTAHMTTPIIVALDFPEARPALELAGRLDPQRGRIKVGKELFTRSGPQLLEQLSSLGFEIFLDLKFHDIPNTVAGACRAAADLGVWMINVHASGGRRMMMAAREALEKKGARTKLVAVTILTSLAEDELQECGFAGSAADNVARLAVLAHDSGMDGVVCSPREAAMLRSRLGSEFLLVTPGIRPDWSVQGDQSRVTTPAQAIAAGASYLVIGRPVTAAAEPLQALEKIERELAAAD